MTVIDTMCVFFAVRYKQKGKSYLEFIITGGVAKSVFLEKYDKLIKIKEIIPIELLLQSEKDALRKECIETGLKFTNKEMNEACRILFILKQM